MFALIITVISIALVAALALATLYYGGTAYREAHRTAESFKVLNQAQQLLGAADVFEADFKRKPHDIGELLSTGYLKTLPQNVLATWTTPLADKPVFVLSSITDLEVCKAVNVRGALQRMAVLKQAYPGLPAQCFGPDAQHLKAVFFKPSGPTGLDGVLTPAEINLSALPTLASDPAWLVP